MTPSQLVDRTSTTIARRFGLQSKGAIAPGKDADVVVFDPAAPRPYGVAVVHERRLRPLRGRDGERQRPPHVLARHARLRPGRDPDGARARPLRRASAGARGGGGMRLVVDADRVLADLRELAELTGGPDGARRLAWSRDWQTAREWLHGKLDELAGDGRARRGRATCGPTLPGRGRPGSSSSARTSTRCPRRLARRRARRAAPRSGCCARHAAARRRRSTLKLRRLGRRGGRALRPLPARLVGRPPARSTPTTCASCRTPRARALPDALRRAASTSTRHPARAPSAWTARSPTSSCTSSRGRCSGAAARRRRR